MLLRTPDYYGSFHCLAGDCPHTCCTGWEVVLDQETAERYGREPGALGEKLRRALKRDSDGDPCFAPEGGRCPFLEESGLCEIHRCLGAEATSETCREHPRFTEDYGPFREVSLSASCPEANRLLLAQEGPLTFVETETAEEVEPGDPWVPDLLAVRDWMLSRLSAGGALYPRLAELLALAEAAQTLLDEDRAEDLPALLAAWQMPKGQRAQGPGLFPEALRVLEALEPMDPEWPGLLKAAETVEVAAVPRGKLERIGAYFLFRYVLKAVNDGDLLSRVRFCVLGVLTVERLAAVCGLEEALRRFSGEIEHSDENLEALLEGFWQLPCLGGERFFQTLEGREHLCAL